jgi:hypothetical protein
MKLSDALIKYMDRTYPSWHVGSNARPSFCACREFGGKCSTPLKRGEQIVKVHCIVMRRGKSRWGRMLRWRIDCYMAFHPIAVEERTWDYREEYAELFQWFSRNPPQLRAIPLEDREPVSYYKPTGNPRGRPHERSSELQQQRNILMGRIRAAKKQLKVDTSFGWEPERTMKREKRIYDRIANLEIQIELLDIS